MAQISRHTKAIRWFLFLILLISLVIGAYALWQMLAPPQPVLSNSAGAGVASGTSSNDSIESATALIVSSITSIASVIALTMSKYTEWQRARLEQKKLAIELEKSEIELQEMRRKLRET